MKEEDEVVIHDNRKQGNRTDLEAITDLCLSDGILAVAKDIPTGIVKYHAGLQKLQNLHDEQERKRGRWPTEVIIMWGPKGTGKTHKAMEMAEADEMGYYMLETPDSNGMLWFDGYRGENTLLIDEFSGEIAFSKMLRIMDIYPMQVGIKGGFTWRNWTRVIITSNDPPARWYPGNPHKPAFQRRITKVINLTKQFTEDGPCMGPAEDPLN